MSRSKGWKMWRSKEILEEEEIETVTDKLIIRNKSTPNTVDRVPISPCLLGPSSGRDRTVIRSAKITLFPQAGEESDPDRFRDTDDMHITHHTLPLASVGNYTIPAGWIPPTPLITLSID